MPSPHVAGLVERARDLLRVIAADGRPGEILIRCDADFGGMSRERLEAAIPAFRNSLIP